MTALNAEGYMGTNTGYETGESFARVSPPGFHTVIFFLAVFFRVTHDGLLLFDYFFTSFFQHFDGFVSNEPQKCENHETWSCQTPYWVLVVDIFVCCNSCSSYLKVAKTYLNMKKKALSRDNQTAIISVTCKINKLSFGYGGTEN